MKNKRIIILFLSLGFITCIINSFSQVRYKDTIFSEIEITEDIFFGAAEPFVGLGNSGSIDSLFFDFYEPVGDEKDLRPLVVTVFGGAFVAGHKRWPDMVNWCNQLAKRGYVCASTDYRLAANYENRASLTEMIAFRVMYRSNQDVRAMVRYAKAHYQELGIDTTHIYIIGSSAGAITALNATYLEEEDVPDYVYGVPFLFSDLGGIDESTNEFTNHTVEFKGTVGLWGAIKDISWISDHEMTPLLMIHGDEDTTVPIDSATVYEGEDSWYKPNLYMYGSRSISHHLDSLNISHHFFPFQGRGHTFYGSDPLYTLLNYDFPAVETLAVNFFAQNNDYFNGNLNNQNDILGIAFENVETSVFIDNNSNSVHVNVPYGTQIDSLMPIFELSQGAVKIIDLNRCTTDESAEIITSIDFSSPIEVQVISETLELKEWTVIVDYGITNTSSDFANNISLYPNPAGDYVIINGALNKSIQIYNNTGQIIIQKTIDKSSQTISLDSFNQGVYFIKFIDKYSNLYTKRLIVL